MKFNNGFRERGTNAGTDEVKKAVKLTPMKKSGKEKHSLYKNLDEDEDDLDLISYKKKESVLDYYDDGDEDYEDEDEEDYDYGEDEDYEDEE